MKYSKEIVTAYWKQCGLPEPVPEYQFHETRRWRFDFAFPEHGVAVEVEGGVWTGGRHTRGAGFRKDMEKYNAAARLGWRILRFVPQEIAMQETVDTIRETLGKNR